MPRNGYRVRPGGRIWLADPWSEALASLWKAYENCFAVRAKDQAVVVDAFGLSDTELVDPERYDAPWREDLTGQCGWAHISPAMEGWTLVYGNIHACRHRRPASASQDGVPHLAARTLCASLSERFGEAHWYTYVNDGGCWDWTAWCLAEAGEVVRYYSHFQADDAHFSIGPPHPAEDGDVLPSDPRLIEAERLYWDASLSGTDSGQAWTTARRQVGLPEDAHDCDVCRVAERASLDPSQLSLPTLVDGYWATARTECGRTRAG